VIAFLRGKLLDNDAETIVIDVGGVGYQVIISSATVSEMPATGGDVQVYIHSHFVADDALRLYGFADPRERQLFQTLLSVQGVGPRVALAILAGMSPSELVRAISSSDVARLTQIKGVGRKIAERLAVELRDKIAALPAGRAAGLAPASRTPALPEGKLGEVFTALVALGYRPSEFEPTLTQLDANRPLADLVKQSLAALQRR
jgi:Holliday junction DNA helicase RuvA